MNIFACDRCEQTVFFESVSCTRCGSDLAFLPDRRVVAALDPSAYRLCRNGTDHAVCNPWNLHQSHHLIAHEQGKL